MFKKKLHTSRELEMAEAYLKVIKVIQSCNTYEQLKAAAQYVDIWKGELPLYAVDLASKADKILADQFSKIQHEKN